jgi:hypothetical protein
MQCGAGNAWLGMDPQPKLNLYRTHENIAELKESRHEERSQIEAKTGVG